MTYFNDFSQSFSMIIDVKDLDYVIQFLNSNNVEWHT
jgi:hypothetical protein